MIAIDTNVLLRYLLQDDETQSLKANALLLGPEKILVTDIVLAEAIWTLKGKRYKLSKQQIVDVVHALLAEPAIVFEDGHAVWGALKDYAQTAPIKTDTGKLKEVDFPDTLIINKVQRYGQKQGIAIKLYTFDKAALTMEGTQHP